MRLPTFVELRDGIRRYADPRYHVRKLIEDLRAMWSMLRSFKSEGPPDKAALAEIFRGKLLATFFMAGPFSWIGFGLSYMLQQRFKNPYIGQYSQVAFNMIFTTLAFQIIWALANGPVYRRAGRTFRERFVAIERDLLPVHWGGIKIGMTFNAITWPLTSFILFIIALINRGASVAIPAAVVSTTLDYAFVNPTFMRLMGDFFQHWSEVLAERHLAESSECEARSSETTGCPG